MELHIIDNPGRNTVVLLNEKMEIVKPVYNYLRYMRLRGRAPNTLKAAGNDLKLYWRFLNENGYSYDAVTPNTIAEFVGYLRRGDIQPDTISLYKESVRCGKTVNRILNTVYQFYKYCGMMREIDNPIIMEDINRPFNMFKNILHHARRDNRTKQSIFKVKSTSKPVRLITDAEAETFLSCLTRKRDRLLFKILYLTGARIQEALDLEIDSIPIPDASQQVGVFQQIKSKGKTRNLYVPMPLIEELDGFILEQRSRIDTEHNHIFVSEQKQYLGKHLTYRGAWEVFRRVMLQTGILFTFHDLRHTFVSHCVESGMDISLVRILAGHEHLSTTQKYTHLSDPYIRESLATYWESTSILGGAADA